MMKKSYDILSNHPINVERMKKGLNPANSIWFWGAGTRPALAPFVEKTGHTGAMISAVDLLKGIAVGADMKVVEVEGANGGLDTNYAVRSGRNGFQDVSSSGSSDTGSHQNPCIRPGSVYAL